MSYLNIPSIDVKLSGAGAKLQWGMAIGIVVDKIVGAKQVVTDDSMLAGIRTQLANHDVRGKVADPSKMSAEQVRVVESILHGAGTKLTTRDLHKVFTGAH